jgi:hypothetical protein
MGGGRAWRAAGDDGVCFLECNPGATPGLESAISVKSESRLLASESSSPKMLLRGRDGEIWEEEEEWQGFDDDDIPTCSREEVKEEEGNPTEEESRGRCWETVSGGSGGGGDVRGFVGRVKVKVAVGSTAEPAGVGPSNGRVECWRGRARW